MQPSPHPHRTRRALVVVLATLGLLLGLAGPASAHVTVKPGEAPKGSFSVLSFSVPNESDTASTVQVEVTFPTGQPIEFVSVQPVPGWTWAAEKSADGAVSKLTWSGGQIRPGEFQLFTVSAGPLPTKVKQIEFKAVQTYSDGEVVRWIESTTKGGPEPEYPAPVLKLVGKSKGH